MRKLRMQITAVLTACLLGLAPAGTALGAEEEIPAAADVLDGEMEPEEALDLEGTPEEEDLLDDQGLLLEEAQDPGEDLTAPEPLEDAPEETAQEAGEEAPEEEAGEENPEEESADPAEPLTGEDVLEESAGEAFLPGNEALSEELFEQYFARELDQSLGLTTVMTAEKRKAVSLRGRQALNETLVSLYDQIAPAISQIADGSLTDSRIPCSFSVTYSAEDLSAYTETDLTSTDAAAAAEASALIKQLAGYSAGSLKRLAAALKADMPYDLYWAATTLPFSLGTARTTRKTTTVDGVRKTLSYTFEITGPFSLQVSKDYRPEGDPGTEEKDASGNTVVRYYRTDPDKTGAAAATTQAAQEIVDGAASLSDLEKLRTYAEKIVDLVSYDQEAANWSADRAVTDYGNPWQLIHVFDGDPATNVVCEGYAKAFKYLCDLTDFEDDAMHTATVMGTLRGVNHMWNQVETSEGNYLVDLTNDDLNAGGESDFAGQLFLVGDRAVNPGTTWKGNPDQGYTLETPDKTLHYLYDEDCRSIYSDAFLTIGPFSDPHGDGDGDGLCDVCGGVLVTGEDIQVCALPFAGSDTTGSRKDKDGRFLYLALAGADAAAFDNANYPRTAYAEKTGDEEVSFLFAGWYEDGEDGNPVPMSHAPDGTQAVYAAFVDKEVLTVRLQLIYGDDLTSEKTSIRFLSTVDSLSYDQTGFAFSIDKGGTLYEEETSSATVYRTLAGRDGEERKTYAPDLFSPASAYFFASILRDIPEEDYNASITVIPFFVTEDGTRVEGTAKTLTPAEYLAQND